MTELRSRFADLFPRVARRLAQAKGQPLRLFVLVLRPELRDVISTTDPGSSSGKWDILVAADWLPENDVKQLQWVVTQVRAFSSARAMQDLSRIVVLSPQHPIVTALADLTTCKEDVVPVPDPDAFGYDQAYVITSGNRLTAGATLS